MTQPDNDMQESLTDAMARVGIVVSEEGKARARQRLAEAESEAGWTPERHAAQRTRLGRPARAA